MLPALAREGFAAATLLIRQLCVGVALSVTAFVAGRTVLGWLAVGFGRRPEAPARPGPVWGASLGMAALATALGLVVLAHAGLLLGLLGWLRPGPVLLTVAAIHLAGLPAWRSLIRRLEGIEGIGGIWGIAGRKGCAGPVEEPRRAYRLAAIASLVALAAFLLPPALLTLYPPTAFDGTLYHLPYARAFAATGGLPFLPDLRIPIFPQLAETLFAVLLPFGGDLAAHGLAFLATLLTSALLLAWGRRYSPAAGWIAAAAYAGSPIVVYLAGTAYVEPELVLFATAALYAAARWLDGGRRACLALAAALAGAAADTKYLGLFVVGMVAVTAVAVPGGRLSPAGSPGGWPRWRRLATVAIASGIVMVPWYGRIVAATGNPVFPFLTGIFGASPWSPLGFHSLADLWAHPGDFAAGFLRLPWDVVFARQRLGGSPPYSPIFLLALPVLAWGAVVRPRVRALLLAAAAYALAVLVLLPDARYLLVALPLGCLAVGDSLAAALAAAAGRLGPAAAGQRRAAVAAAFLAAVISLPGWCYATYRLYRQGPVPVTAGERESYLARALPAYSAVRFLDRACGTAYTLYAIHAENLVYFAGGRFLGDWTGPASYTAVVVPAHGDARLLYQRLRSLGVDHLLTLEGDPGLPPIFGPSFDGLFQRVYADGRARLFELRGAGCGPPTAGGRSSLR